MQNELRVSLDQVKEMFENYVPHLQSVHFVEGSVRDTLPGFNASLGDDDIAVLRVDLDMYEGIMDLLFHLLPRVPPGGYVIFDDYFCTPEAKRAVDDFRKCELQRIAKR